MVKYKSADSPAALHHSAEHPRKTDFSLFERKNRARAKSGMQRQFFWDVAIPLGRVAVAGLASIILDSLRNIFELRPICSAKIRNSKLGKKESRRGAPSVLYSPREIPNLKGCATPSVAPRLPMQNYD